MWSTTSSPPRTTRISLRTRTTSPLPRSTWRSSGTTLPLALLQQRPISSSRSLQPAHLMMDVMFCGVAPHLPPSSRGGGERTGAMEAPDSMLQPSSASTAGARLPVASQQSAPAGAYADIRVDPRTGLAIIDVPHEYRSDFSELEGSLIHYFSKVKRIGSRDKAQDRIMVISDSCIYLFLLTGLTTTRCIPIQDIQEVLYSRDNDIGFRLPETEQYDCMCLLSTNQERDTVLEIVRKIYTFFTGEALPVRRVDVSVIKQSLQLKMPKGWQVKLEPIQTKKLLAQQLQAQQQEDDSEQRILNEEFERIKGKLRSELELQVQQRNEEFAQFKREYQSLQEAHNNLVVQYDAMAQDVETYVKLLNEKDAELERYRSGDHPRFKELEHELEKVMYKKDLEEHKQRVTLQQQVESRDEQLRHKDELLRMKDQQYYSLQMSEQHLMEQVRQKDEEIVALEQALRDRDVLLQ
eukprot:Sspe_Gene.50566::Locus_28141_Transcript_3_3_Confidence_0.500_Length_2094::g.50566::m.50566